MSRNLAPKSIRARMAAGSQSETGPLVSPDPATPKPVWGKPGSFVGVGLGRVTAVSVLVA